jgi:hypothetical protein
MVGVILYMYECGALKSINVISLRGVGKRERLMEGMKQTGILYI